MSDLVQRGAVVTGANRGIGKAIALAYLRAGWPVLAIARTPESLDALRKEAGDLTSRIRTLACDLSDAAQLDGAARALAATDPVPAVLVNNAGISLSAPLQRTSDEDLHRVLQINAIAPYVLCRALVPRMADAGGGRVINIGSIASLKGIRYTSAYCASKHALLGLTRALAVEWGKRNVTVNAVCPGWTETDMFSKALDAVVQKTGRSADQAREAVLANNPMGRSVKPEEVAGLVLYLSSPEAAGLTGAALSVDCGEAA
ncbi:MAG TPA: SDR family oxidoreductase [Myxococcaceae bacterium]|jgi:NAD(P)-dependent dehydrogenase (short-subunit alcohol dehydrogenase family)